VADDLAGLGLGGAGEFFGGGLVEEVLRLVVAGKEGRDAGTLVGIGRAGTVEEGRPFVGGQRKCLGEDVFVAVNERSWLGPFTNAQFWLKAAHAGGEAIGGPGGRVERRARGDVAGLRDRGGERERER